MNDAPTAHHPDALALHQATLTLDSHIDIPWPNGADPFTETARHVDLPKMRAGGLKAGCFVAFVPQATPTPDMEQAATARAFAMLDDIAAMEGTRNGLTARLCPTADAVEQAAADGALAIIPAVENGQAVGEDLATLVAFRARGVAYITLTHNGHNQLADSCNPRRDLNDPPTRHEGLSGLGREAIAEMNRLGILVDVSHVSRQAMLQAVMLSRTPIVATHSCAATLCDHPRNLTDMQLDALRDTGGLVQITAMPPFLKARGRSETVSVADFVDHIDYVVNRIGLAHCGISSDFDGGGAITHWRNAAETPNVTAELVRRGYGPAEITALWGGNFLRLMRTAEAHAAGHAGPGTADTPPSRA